MFDSVDGAGCAAENVGPPTTTGEGATCAGGLGDAGWNVKVPATIGWAAGGVTCASGIGADDVPTCMYPDERTTGWLFTVIGSPLAGTF